MAREEREIRVEPHTEGTAPRPTTEPEPSLGELFKRVTTDTNELVRQEIALAKTEMRQASATLARDGTKIGVGLGLALVGAFAFTAFLIAGLGRLLDGRYWLSALIIGVVLLAIGALFARNALADVKRRGLTPDQTMATLRDDAAWARREARDVKREMTT